jgi:hypothetical protein
MSGRRGNCFLRAADVFDARVCRNPMTLKYVFAAPYLLFRARMISLICFQMAEVLPVSSLGLMSFRLSAKSPYSVQMTRCEPLAG